MKKRSDIELGGSDLRRRAEHRLRKQSAGRTRIETRTDMQRLNQELQIHQIELELQNEELKQSKAEVDASLEKFTELYDFAPIGYLSLDEQGLISDANLMGAALLGTEKSLLIDRRFQLFVAPPSRQGFNTFLQRIFDGHEKQGIEALLLNAGRTAFWTNLQATAAITFSGAKKWCRLAVIDISARKQAEEAHKQAEEARHRNDILAATNRQLQEDIVRRQAMEAALKKSELRANQLLDESRELQKKMRRFSHQILLAQERERKEISRDLHDRVSQLLIGVNVHLGAFTRTAAIKSKGAPRNFAPLHRMVIKSLRAVHQFAQDLRPAVLDDLGLVPALTSYLKRIPKPKNLKIKFKIYSANVILDDDKQTVVYRVVQEALANVIKYARASVVKVVILKIQGGIVLEIADDGDGFDVNLLGSPKWRHHLGVIGMRERVEMVGGRFSVISTRGMGTTIRVEIPHSKKRSA